MKLRSYLGPLFSTVALANLGVLAGCVASEKSVTTPTDYGGQAGAVSAGGALVTAGGTAGSPAAGGPSVAGGTTSTAGGSVSLPNGGSTMAPSAGAPARGGAPAAGGTSQVAAGGVTGRGGQANQGGFVAATCAPDSSLPEIAPALRTGEWQNISPPGVPFNTQNGSFTQGMTTDPCNAATLYVCVVGFERPAVNFNGVYRTLDAGTTWARIGPMDFPVNIRVNPANPKHIYAADGVSGGTMGFWVSKDGGETWEVPAGFKAVVKDKELIYDTYHVEPDPTNFNHVLVTFHNGWAGAAYKGNSGIIESFDGGTTWKVHPPVNTRWAGGYNVFFLHEPKLGIGDVNTWLFGTQGEGYWRTTDAGATWTKVSNVDMDHGGGTIYYTKDGTLYVSGAPSVLRSKDNGATWTELVPTQFAQFLSITGDGTSLYTGPHFGGAFLTAPENADTTWRKFGNDPAAFANSGPFELRFDSVNSILYSAHTGAGVWALKVK